MHVRKLRSKKAVYISNHDISRVLKGYQQGKVDMSFSEVNTLRSELHKWSHEWLRTGLIVYMSNSKASAIKAGSMSSVAFYHLRAKVMNFNSYCKAHGIKIRGYEFTINPAKLTYKGITKLNHKIIRKFKSYRHIAFIERAIEHTYEYTSINVHLHYLVVTTDRINQRAIYRQIKAIAKHITHGNVNKSADDSKPYRQVDDWHKAISYVTKQCGRFPLMMVHHQYSKFMTLTEQQRINLLARDYNEQKHLRLHLHQFYVNSNNPLAKAWRAIKHQQHRQPSRPMTNAHHKAVKATANGRIETVNSIVSDDRHTISRHHYSEKENLSRFYGHDTYAWKKQPCPFKALSLFQS